MSALVVEDDAVQGAILTELLRRNGWRTEWATNKESAKVKLKAYVPDLLLLDVSLGPDNGLTLLRETKDYPFRIVILTALADEDVNRVHEEFPKADIIKKPADPADIIRVIGQGHKGVQLEAKQAENKS